MKTKLPPFDFPTMTGNYQKLIKILNIATKIFLVGLLLQFFLQTFFTFKLGLTGTFRDIVRMRKEIIIVLLFILLIYLIRKNKLRASLWKKLPIKGFIILFIAVIFLTLTISLLISKVGIGNWIMSIKYSMMGFLIFILFFTNTFILDGQKEIQITQRYNNVIKNILIGALIRRGIIRIVPRVLEFAGYSRYTYEGTLTTSPPTTYYTEYNQGYARNQFLFERPISLGFFLIVFWPLFFMLALRNRGRKNILFRGGLYGLIVFSTFSRAARGARFFLTFLLIFTQYQKIFLKILVYGIMPLLLIFGTVAYIGKDQIIGRSFSDVGHIQSLKEAIVKIKANPIWGQAGSAGPASYHLGKDKEFNPENQFLQIWLEYGIFGFVGWILLYGYLIKIGYTAYFHAINLKNIKKNRFYGFLIFAFSLGLVGLAIQGLVLHSFVDRMIVYPFMALFGITYAIYQKSLINIEVKHKVF